MTLKTIKLDAGDLSTIRLALMGWAERCKAEAKLMNDLERDMRDEGKVELAEKCQRNAAASLEFKQAADELLASDKLR